jgi:hypothetical protein
MVLAEGIEIAELTKRILKICCRTCVVRTARFQLFWPLSSHRTSMHAPASRSNKCGVVRVHGVVPDKLTPTTRMANTHLWFSLSLSLSLSLSAHTHTQSRFVMTSPCLLAPGCRVEHKMQQQQESSTTSGTHTH